MQGVWDWQTFNTSSPEVYETYPDFSRCMSLSEQSNALLLSLHAGIGNLTFQLCNIGDPLVFVQGIRDKLVQPLDTKPLKSLTGKPDSASNA